MSETLKELGNLFNEWAEKMSRWQEKDIKDINENFYKDGVVYGQELDDSKRYEKWDKRQPNEKRVLFIGKDPNVTDQIKKELKDMDNDLSRWYSVKMTNRYRRSLNYYTQKINGKKEEDVDMEENTYPYAWINIKKYGGGEVSNDDEIMEHLEYYGDLLLRQIEILRPTDIVCLGTTPNALPKLKKALKEKRFDFEFTTYSAPHPSRGKRCIEEIIT